MLLLVLFLVFLLAGFATTVKFLWLVALFALVVWLLRRGAVDRGYWW